jgi:hypothetical protein
VITVSDDFSDYNRWLIGSGLSLGSQTAGPDDEPASAWELSGSGMISTYDDQVPETQFELAQSSVTKIVQMEVLPEGATPPEIVGVGNWRRVSTGIGVSASAACAWPAGHQADDIGIVMVRGSGVNISDPGWTEIGSYSGNNVRFYWARAAGSSEPGVIVNFPTTGGHARMFIVRGALKTGSPIGNFSRDDTATDSAQKQAPHITANDGSLVVVMAAFFRRTANLYTSRWRNSSLYNIRVHIDGVGQTASNNGGGWILSSGNYYVRGKIDSGPVRASIFVKHLSGDARIRLVNSLTGAYSEFDLDTLVAGSDGTIEAYDDDWYRITVRSDAPYGFGVQLMGGDFSIFRANLVGTEDYYQPLLNDNPMTGDAAIASLNALLLYSSIPEPDPEYPPESSAVVWDGGTTYGENDRVTKNHSLYISNESGNTSDPETNSTGENPKWTRLGTTNSWRMFDMFRTGAGSSRLYPGVDQATVGRDFIDVIVYAPGVVRGYALLGIDAGVLEVWAYKAGVEVYRRETTLVDLAASAYWYEYFTKMPSRRASVVAFDLPAVGGLTLRFRLRGEGRISLGKILVGVEEEAGCTLPDFTTDFYNTTRQTRDQFENLELVPRRVLKSKTFRARYKTNRAEGVESLVERLMWSPAVFVGSENFATSILYGYIKTCSTTTNRNVTVMTLGVESI